MLMRSRFAGSTILLVLAAVVAAAQPTVKTVKPGPTSPTSGKDMFAEYCAVCHGTDAKGNGPAAPALKKKPADLTQLAARNQGKFPAERVSLYIEGAESVTAHGTREMPIWGEVFKSMAANPDVAKIRVVNLTDYVKTLQAR
jgi:mono/diheme cytochrome c family protein